MGVCVGGVGCKPFTRPRVLYRYFAGCRWLLLGLLPPSLSLSSSLMPSMWKSEWSPLAAPTLQILAGRDSYITSTGMLEVLPAARARERGAWATWGTARGQSRTTPP